jgi:hypothetical protein
MTAEGFAGIFRSKPEEQPRDKSIRPVFLRSSWNGKLIAVDRHPKAQAAFDQLSRQVRHPFDPTESE